MGILEFIISVFIYFASENPYHILPDLAIRHRHRFCRSEVVRKSGKIPSIHSEVEVLSF